MKRRNPDTNENPIGRQLSVGRKPIYEDDEDDVNRSSRRVVRQRTANSFVELPPIDISSTEIIPLLSQLGTNFIRVAESRGVSPEQTSKQFGLIQNELNTALITAFESAKNEIIQRELNEASAMEVQEDISRRGLPKVYFFDRLKPLTDRVSQLTCGEQALMFETTLQTLNNCIHNYELSVRTANQIEPDYSARLSEIQSILYSWALTQLSMIISNIYQTYPEIVKKIMAIIASVCAIYNYLPGNIRNLLINIPYLGGLFALLNGVNSDALIIQNSAATVTSIYYLLRNAGMIPTEAMEALKTMAIEAAETRAMNLSRTISRNVSVSITKIRDSTTIILDKIGSKLGDILTTEYHDFSFGNNQNLSQESQDSDSSTTSIRSAHTVNTDSKNSVRSHQSVEIVESLLNTPVMDGGIDLGNDIPPDVLEERFTPLLEQIDTGSQSDSVTVPVIDPVIEGVVINPIIANPMEMTIAAVDAVPVLERNASISSISSLGSNSSTGETAWDLWVFGRSHRGGRRFRKSRRHRKNKKTRKGKRNNHKKRLTYKRRRIHRKSRKH